MTIAAGANKGQRRAKSGKAGELPVEAQLHLCRIKKIARVFRVPNDVQPIRTKGRLVAFPKRKSGPDYLGVLSNGQAVALEVKHCQATRIKRGVSAPRLDLRNIEPHQVSDLLEIEKMGGLAFVVLVHSGPLVQPTFFRIPIAAIHKAVLGGDKSITEIVLQPFRVPPGTLLLEGLP